jgi:type II secretion system protein C
MRFLFAALLAIETLLGAEVALANPFDYNVLGVIASSQNQKGVALVKHKASGRVNAYREGQDISTGFKVERIHRKTVTFSFQNRYFDLSVGDENPTENKGYIGSGGSGVAVASDLRQAQGIERQGQTLKVSRSLKDNLAGENLNKVLMQAAAVPHVENGRLVGFQLLEIDEGSIFDMAGFRDGDIITHINEQPINDAAIAIRALNGLKAATSATFGYRRGTQPMELVVQIH